MADTYPPHVETDIAEMGHNTFSKSQYDGLREYIQALKSSDERDMSDTAMNIQGQHLQPVEGVEPPYIGPLTITEYICDKAPDLTEYDLNLEDAYMSWEAGAFKALKSI